ncbi:hypothetical protein SNEBB_004945 [Seison nebaliae]|nr:hypothetical protein SNEBB_004945 [Seison nebaliae]
MDHSLLNKKQTEIHETVNHNLAELKEIKKQSATTINILNELKSELIIMRKEKENQFKKDDVLEHHTKTPTISKKLKYSEAFAKNSNKTPFDKKNTILSSKVPPTLTNTVPKKNRGTLNSSNSLLPPKEKDIKKCVRRVVLTVLNTETTAADIAAHLEEQLSVKASDILTFPNVRKNSKKFIVVTNGEFFEQIKDSRSWPGHIFIENFRFNHSSIELFKKCKSLNNPISTDAMEQT